MFTGKIGSAPHTGGSSTQHPTDRSPEGRPQGARVRHSEVGHHNISAGRPSVRSPDREREFQHSRSQPRSPQRASSRKTLERYTSSRQAPRQEITLGEAHKIIQQISHVHAQCCLHMRSQNFAKACQTINEMGLTLNGARHLIRNYTVRGEDAKKLLELDEIMMALVMIAKYHQPSTTQESETVKKSSKDYGFASLTKHIEAPVKWQVNLPRDYETLDWSDFRRAVIFADSYLLNESMHFSFSKEAVTDRLKAARDYLIWALDSRALKNTSQPQWLDCYTKICDQLFKIDPEFAASEEGQKAKKLVELVNKLHSTHGIEQACAVLKEHHEMFIRKDFSQDAALIMACGARAMNTKQFDGYDRSKSVRQQQNILYYGWSMLAFGPRCYRDSVDNKAGVTEFVQSLISFGRLGIPMKLHQKIIREFTLDLINEQNFNPADVRDQVSECLSKHCAIMMDTLWLKAMDTINNGHLEEAERCLKELSAPNRRLTKFELEVVDLTQAWCYLQDNRFSMVVKRLNKRQFHPGTISHLKAARLYLSAGDVKAAKKLVAEATHFRPPLNSIVKLSYHQLKEQIEQQEKESTRRSELSGLRKTDQPSHKRKSAPRPEPAPKRKKTEPLHESGDSAGSTSQAVVLENKATQTPVTEVKTVDTQVDTALAGFANEHQELQHKYARLENKYTTLKEENERFCKVSKQYSEYLKGKIRLLEQDSNAVTVAKLKESLQQADHKSAQQLTQSFNATLKLQQANNGLREELEKASLLKAGHEQEKNTLLADIAQLKEQVAGHELEKNNFKQREVTLILNNNTLERELKDLNGQMATTLNSLNSEKEKIKKLKSCKDKKIKALRLEINLQKDIIDINGAKVEALEADNQALREKEANRQQRSALNSSISVTGADNLPMDPELFQWSVEEFPSLFPDLEML